MKKILIGVVLLLVILGAIGGGGYYTVDTVKKSVRSQASEQSSNLKLVQKNSDEIIRLYQIDTSENINSGTNKSSVKVLGASTGPLTRQQLSQQAGSVLGVEDTPLLQTTRDIVEQTTQALERIDKIEKTNTSISQTPNLSLYTTFFKTTIPTEKTGQTVKSVKDTMAFLKAGEELTLKAVPVMTEMGVTLGVAIVRADEESINKFESELSKIKEYREQEKKIKVMSAPEEIKKAVATESVSDEMYANFEKLPGIIRKKDSLELQKVMTDIVLKSKTEGNSSRVRLVTALKADKDLRSLSELSNEWSSVGK